jgi:hypothetical protein
VILHNIIIESERKFPVFYTEPYEQMGPFADVDPDVPPAFAAFLARHQEVRDTKYSPPVAR